MDLQQHAIKHELRDLQHDLKDLLPLLRCPTVLRSGDGTWFASPYELQRALRALRIKLSTEHMTLFLGH